jgi:hypothetical protein
MAQSKQVIPAFEPKAPDAIMAKLWRTKQRINAEAGYDIDRLLARVKREQQLYLVPIISKHYRQQGDAAGRHHRQVDC